MCVATADLRQARRYDVGRDEQMPPPLVLVNVNQLVGKNPFVELVHTQDDVAEGDGSIVPAESSRPRCPFTN